MPRERRNPRARRRTGARPERSPAQAAPTRSAMTIFTGSAGSTGSTSRPNRWTNIYSFDILGTMRQIILSLDDVLAEQLDRVAPARSRQRSEFIRQAIKRAIYELSEHSMIDAFTR